MLRIILLCISCLFLLTVEAAAIEAPDPNYTGARRLLDQKAKRVDWKRLDLNRKAKHLSARQFKRRKRVEVEDSHVAFEWQKDDGNTYNWYPQGIAGLPGKRMAISWYSRHGMKSDLRKDDFHTSAAVKAATNRGARISFIDVSNPKKVKYRHVLLVKGTKRGKDIGIVETHAGGIAYHDNHLYVAEGNAARRGIIVFDVRDMWELKSIGKEPDIGLKGTKVYGHGHRYVLLQKKHIRSNALKFAYASLDWTWRPDNPTEAPLLVTGNYHNADKASPHHNPPAGISWWKILYDGAGRPRLKLVKNTTRPDEKLWFPPLAQGAAVRDGVVWVSTSGGNPKLFVGRYPAKRRASYADYPWIDGAEDLHYSKRSGLLWSLSEWPGSRYFFAVKAWDYPPP